MRAAGAKQSEAAAAAHQRDTFERLGGGKIADHQRRDRQQDRRAERGKAEPVAERRQRQQQRGGERAERGQDQRLCAASWSRPAPPCG